MEWMCQTSLNFWLSTKMVFPKSLSEETQEVSDWAVLRSLPKSNSPLVGHMETQPLTQQKS